MRPIRKRSASHPSGLHVEGPGFYLWDSDPREARRLAADLGRYLPRPPTADALRPSPRPPVG